MLLSLDTDQTPVAITKPGATVCPACGSVAAKVQKKRKGIMPTVAPNPYDTPVKVDPNAQALIDRGKDQVAKARAKAKRQAFAERAATWTPERIREEMAKIDDAVKAHEGKIAECLRQRMILEQQLEVAEPAVVRPGVAAVQPTPAPTPEPEDPCPF